MKNGSVWDWLHRLLVSNKKKTCLDCKMQLKIAVGLAQGVEHLHHDCAPLVIHRDTKSSNVLLNSEMEAHSGDFGLAKVVLENNDSSYIESSSCFSGSYGYRAPEYAYTMKATEKSGMYNMGIVLVSKRMPIDTIAFGVDTDMVRWVKARVDMSGAAREELVDCVETSPARRRNNNFSSA